MRHPTKSLIASTNFSARIAKSLSANDTVLIDAIKMGKSRDRSSENHECSAKRKTPVQLDSEQPKKRTKILLGADNSDYESSTVSPSGGVAINTSAVQDDEGAFKVNEDYAKRFEHNKKREELQRRTIALIVVLNIY